jgi:hypothetical protein
LISSNTIEHDLRSKAGGFGRPSGLLSIESFVAVAIGIDRGYRDVTETEVDQMSNYLCLS